jgi:hypothetical protein
MGGGESISMCGVRRTTAPSGEGCGGVADFFRPAAARAGFGDLPPPFFFFILAGAPRPVARVRKRAGILLR